MRVDFASPGPGGDPWTPNPSGPGDKDLQRSDGAVRLAVAGSAHGTRIVDVFQRSPLRILFPRIRHAPVDEAVLVNTAGGIAGGDRLECEVTVLTDATITVTSQTAERIYRALDAPAQIETKLTVSDAARLAWLPQETIVFDGGRVRRNIEIEMSSGAEVLALESLVLGRAASGEVLASGQITDGWRVRRDGKLIWADRFHAADDVLAQLQRQALLADARAISTLIYFGPEIEARVQFVRDLAPQLQCHCVATTVSGLMVARLAGADPADVKTGLREILKPFNPSRRQSPFRVPKMWSC